MYQRILFSFVSFLILFQGVGAQAVAIFSDDFDYENLNQIPSQWVNGPWSNVGSNYVTNSISFSGNNSVHVQSFQSQQKGIYAPGTATAGALRVSARFFLPLNNSNNQNYGGLDYLGSTVFFTYQSGNRAAIKQWSSANATFLSSETISTGEWHLLEVVFNGLGSREVFIDGASFGVTNYDPSLATRSGYGYDISLRGDNNGGVRTLYFDNIEIVTDVEEMQEYGDFYLFELQDIPSEIDSDIPDSDLNNFVEAVTNTFLAIPNLLNPSSWKGLINVGLYDALLNWGQYFGAFSSYTLICNENSAITTPVIIIHTANQLRDYGDIHLELSTDVQNPDYPHVLSTGQPMVLPQNKTVALVLKNHIATELGVIDGGTHQFGVWREMQARYGFKLNLPGGSSFLTEGEKHCGFRSGDSYADNFWDAQFVDPIELSVGIKKTIETGIDYPGDKDVFAIKVNESGFLKLSVKQAKTFGAQSNRKVNLYDFSGDLIVSDSKGSAYFKLENLSAGTYYLSVEAAPSWVTSDYKVTVKLQ